MSSKRILLLSAYDANSHRYWHQQIITGMPQHQWQLLTLKDRFFSWRMGGNAMSFKNQFHQKLQQKYDVLLATSMTDLSTLVGLYPHLNQIPKLLYFHENQFAYPKNNNQQGLLEIQLRNIYAAMVADQLFFNSAYNRDSFLSGVSGFIDKMPDGISQELLSTFDDKAYVLPVPIKGDCVPTDKTVNNKVTEVIWNHRWEHDKGPETLLKLMQLCANQPNIKFHVIGQKFRNIPPSMQEIINNHKHQCLTLGYVESREKYIEILQHADVVLSTAHHDFQGISVLEAVACGCKPIVPNRLVYPEYYSLKNCYDSTPDHTLKEAHCIYQLLQNPDQLPYKAPDLSWGKLKSSYEKIPE